MLAHSLIAGLHDIAAQRIPTNCIIDMAPSIIDSLNLLVSSENQASFSGYGYVFISGKVTGLRRQQAASLFKDAEQLLHGKGLKPINPLSLLPSVCPWPVAMRMSLNYMLNHCNKIYFIDNWHHSKGAQIQKSLADALNFSTIQFSDT